MSKLVVGFAMRKCKRAANTQKKTTPGLEVLGGKSSKPSGFDEKVQADLVVIIVDLLKQVLEAPSAVRGAA